MDDYNQRGKAMNDTNRNKSKKKKKKKGSNNNDKRKKDEKPGTLAIFGARKVQVENQDAGDMQADQQKQEHQQQEEGRQHEEKRDPPQVNVKLVTKPQAASGPPAPVQTGRSLSPSISPVRVRPSAVQSKSTPVKQSVPLKSVGEGFKLVDENFMIYGDEDVLPAGVIADNCGYRVVGVVGKQGVGKSFILNRLGGESCRFPVQDEHHKTTLTHCTRGIDVSFKGLGSERVLLLDCQPVCSPSIIASLMEETSGEENNTADAQAQDNPARIASLRDVQMLVFLFSVCDVVLVVEDYGDTCRSLWRLLRHAYLVMEGDASKQVISDWILVCNRVPKLDLDNTNKLLKKQQEWVDFFGDLIPHAAKKPKLDACFLGESVDLDSPELIYLKHLILFRGHGNSNKWSLETTAGPRDQYDDYDDDDDNNLHSVVDEQFELVFDENDNDNNNTNVGERDEMYTHYHRLQVALLLNQKSQRKGAKPLSKVGQPDQLPRKSESLLLQHATNLWTKQIPESIQFKEFATLIDINSIFTL